MKTEQEILKTWKEKDLLVKTIDNRSEDNKWVFYDGPATANGNPGGRTLEMLDIPEIEGAEMPKPHDFLSEKQRDGNELQAKEIYEADENGETHTQYRIYECCGLKEVINGGLFHTIEEVEAKEATCTEGGNTAGERCTICDYKTYEEIEATNHKDENYEMTFKSVDENEHQIVNVYECGHEDKLSKAAHTKEEVEAQYIILKSYLQDKKSILNRMDYIF